MSFHLTADEEQSLREDVAKGEPLSNTDATDLLATLDARLADERRRTWEAWQTAWCIEEAGHLFFKAAMISMGEMVEECVQRHGWVPDGGPVLKALVTMVVRAGLPPTDPAQQGDWASLMKPGIEALEAAVKAHEKAQAAQAAQAAQGTEGASS